MSNATQTTTLTLSTLTLTGEQLDTLRTLLGHRIDFCEEATVEYDEDHRKELGNLRELRSAVISAAKAAAPVAVALAVDTAETTAAAASQATIRPAKRIVWRNVTSSNPDKPAISDALRAAAGVTGGKVTMVRVSKDGARVRGHVMVKLGGRGQPWTSMGDQECDNPHA